MGMYIYFIGLFILSAATGSLEQYSAVNGFIVFGTGTILMGIAAIMLKYLDGPNKS